MLRPRIIPSLLIHDKGLVKTVHFKNPKYVGDPINAVKIFNEKEVDELALFDIDASVNNVEPDYHLIERLANQSRMPLCYGGGVKTVEQAQRIFGLGIEKIALSSSIVQHPGLIPEIAERVGTQSVIAVLDVKRKFLGGYEVYIHNGKKSTGINPFTFVVKLQQMGVGEIIINSIDQDGAMKGFDMPLIDKIREQISIPLTVLGGAGNLDDIGGVINKHGVIGVAAGSLFVFKGVYKAVLINYPTRREKDELIKQNYKYHSNIIG
ncbi:AglZ/HisF2 family acetamidino modification protein [Pedobacter helvus]|uniref:imidazole glycerol-phosphate synthase n=1 Tax=Pedobacter helvus TaxID=2563444 RepID=A0ABW9JFI2_9SPHI|nr:AglZ/HisF2 family acetamidino modification protein [Pedobacter ureilyticus]